MYSHSASSSVSGRNCSRNESNFCRLRVVFNDYRNSNDTGDNDAGASSSTSRSLSKKFIYGFNVTETITVGALLDDLRRHCEIKETNLMLKLSINDGESSYVFPESATVQAVLRDNDKVFLNAEPQRSAVAATDSTLMPEKTAVIPLQFVELLEGITTKFARGIKNFQTSLDKSAVDLDRLVHEKEEKLANLLKSPPTMETASAATPICRGRKRKIDSVLLDSDSPIEQESSKKKLVKRRKKKKKASATSNSPKTFTESLNEFRRFTDNKTEKLKRDAKQLYDNAMVIRDGSTGKIQHVYFGSDEERNPPGRLKSTPVAKTNGCIKPDAKEQQNAPIEEPIAINETVTCQSLERLLPENKRQEQKRSGAVTTQAKIIKTNKATPPTTKSDRYTNKSIVLENVGPRCTSSESQPPIVNSKTNANGTDALKTPNGKHYSTDDIERFPLLMQPWIRIDDKLAYKIMELSKVDCTPMISDWKIGTVLAFNHNTLEIELELISGDPRCDVPEKFRLIDRVDDDGVYNEDAVNDTTTADDQPRYEVVNWTELISARIIKDL